MNGVSTSFSGNSPEEVLTYFEPTTETPFRVFLTPLSYSRTNNSIKLEIFYYVVQTSCLAFAVYVCCFSLLRPAIWVFGFCKNGQLDRLQSKAKHHLLWFTRVLVKEKTRIGLLIEGSHGSAIYDQVFRDEQKALCNWFTFSHSYCIAFQVRWLWNTV